MKKEKKTERFATLLVILFWGGLWGVFESTVGYLLHLLPFSIGWLVWYPVACFFMLNVYRRTKRTEAVLLVGLLSAGIKLLNLFLPVRIDKVLNPAVSIVFEAISMVAVIFVIKHFFVQKQRPVLIKIFAILGMNTGWRILYMLYLLFLVPDWIREISVISSAEAFVTFFVLHNLGTSMFLLIGSSAKKYILHPIKVIEDTLSVSISSFSNGVTTGIKTFVAVILISASIALQLLL